MVGLTWRDLVSSIAVVLTILAWAAFALRTGTPLLTSAWASSVAALPLSAFCAVAATGDLHTMPQPRAGVILRKITTVLGAIALIAGLTGLIADSGPAVEILVMATILLWAVGTCWHVMSLGSQ